MISTEVITSISILLLVVVIVAIAEWATNRRNDRK